MAEARFILDTAALEAAVRNVTAPVLARIGEAVATEAKRLAPVDTGRLRASIGSTPQADGSVIVGTDVEYGPYQEYGTRLQPAQPFMQPAIYLVAARVARKRGGA